MPQISFEQLAEGYAALTGAQLKLGSQFSEIVKNFILDFAAIAQKQGVADNGIIEIADQ